MSSSQTRNELFYHIKPMIPRRVQIALRRQLAKRTLKKLGSSWHINEKAGTAPANWFGWPDRKKFALILRHDVESTIGHDRCLQLRDLEQSRGLRSSFYFVPERYPVAPNVREKLVHSGFEVGVHGLNHDGKLYQSQEIFSGRAAKINEYIGEWNAEGFCAPASHHVLEWNHLLNIAYDSSTFDTAPFEPQPDNVDTIFPFWVEDKSQSGRGYVELPYTLTQDFYVYIILQEKTTDIWKKKLDWIAERGGMAMLITHPDYMSFTPGQPNFQEYPAALYEEFLDYAQTNYAGEYWNATASEIAAFYRAQMVMPVNPPNHLQVECYTMPNLLAHG